MTTADTMTPVLPATPETEKRGGCSSPASCSPPVFYSDSLVTIYHGDASEIAPRLEPSGLLFTDPPYGTSRYHKGVDGFLLLDLAWGVEAAVFGWPEKLCEFVIRTGRAPNEWITWWAMNAGQKGFNLNGLWKETEAIAFWGNPKPFAKCKRPRGSNTRYSQKMRQQGYTESRNVKTDLVTDGEARLGDVWLDSSPGLLCNAHCRQHPNEKPMSVISRIIEALQPASVLDPFCGSGTTLAAAKRAGIKSVGIEIEEAHCETAARRCASELAMGKAENDPSSATRRTRAFDCNRDAHAGFAAAHG
jgi:DNA modification methylase